jgi:hypothetical protein
MKKIILLSFLSSALMGYAQTSPIDFEPGGNGAAFSWATFEAPEGFANPTFTVEANPVIDGINTSATAAKIDIAYPTTDAWGKAGCETDIQGNNMGIFSFNESNSTVSLMVFQVGFAAPVALKFVNNTFGAAFETIVPNTVANEWVEITFDLSGLIPPGGVGPYSQMVFFPSYAPRETGHVVWFDNVVFGEGGTGPEDPLVPAPNPTVNEDLVISVYSDFYTINTVADFNFNAFQGAGAVSEIQIEGNNTGKIDGLSFYGAEWGAADLNEFEYVHLDYWSAGSTAFNFYLIDQSAAIPGGTPEEPRYAFAAAGGDQTIVQDQWVGVNIPLQHFLDYPSTGFNYDVDDIFQWKFDGNGTIYFDNIYFAKESVGVENLPASAFQTFPNPANDAWTIKSDNATITKVQVFNVLGQQVRSSVPNTDLVTINAADLKPGLYLTRVQTAAGTSVLKLIKE